MRTLQTMALIRMKSKVRTGAVSGLREKSDYAAVDDIVINLGDGRIDFAGEVAEPHTA